MGRSLIIAFVAVIALVLWMLSGPMGIGKDDASSASNSTANTSENTEVAQDGAPNGREKEVPKMKVQTLQLSAKSIDREIVVQGQLEPAKVMSLRAETSGTVQTLSFNKGERIRRGQTLARLSEGNRLADLAVAKANYAQSDNEYQAANKLSRQGLQSTLSMEAASAQREAARAQVQAAELELSYVSINSPIDALLENIAVEEGDYIERGAQIATLVDNSSLLVTGRVSQQHIRDIKNGQAAIANLVTGETLQGSVTFISSMADNTTRSFEVEILIDQPPQSIVTGISAEIIIPVETLMAHKVSPAVLALGDDGSLGVKALGEENKVVFHEIEVVKTESNGAWVTGLPNEVTLITLGQGFVNPGEVVEPVADTNPADTNQSDTSDS